MQVSSVTCPTTEIVNCHLVPLLQEGLECVAELNSTSLLYVFVRCSVESMLDRSVVMRERLGVLLCHLIQEGALPTQQFYKG